MSNPNLKFEGLTKGYNIGQPNEVRVLTGAAAQIDPGEVVALVAPSGAGKSTLLHIIGLLDTPDGGTLEIAGQDMAGQGDKMRTLMRRTTLGFVYQFHHLLPEFTAAENIILPQRAMGVGLGPARERAMDLLARVGLESRANHRPSQLSGGEQQRVAFCRALANGPRLLLADEPTGNLDPETSDHVFDMLVGLVRDTGLSALIATHNMELAGRMDRTLRLHNGTLIAE